MSCGSSGCGDSTLSRRRKNNYAADRFVLAGIAKNGYDMKIYDRTYNEYLTYKLGTLGELFFRHGMIVNGLVYKFTGDIKLKEEYMYKRIRYDKIRPYISITVNKQNAINFINHFGLQNKVKINY